MNHAHWETIANTPWWLYVFFIYLSWMAYLATKPRLVPVKSIFIFPVFFITLSIISLYLSARWNLLYISIWAAALVTGTLLGWLQFRLLKIKAVKNKSLLYMPGTWSLLVIIFTLFIAKFYFGFDGAIHPNQLSNPHFIRWIFLLYGIFTGLFIGRITYAVRCLKKGPFVPENISI